MYKNKLFLTGYTNLDKILGFDNYILDAETIILGELEKNMLLNINIFATEMVILIYKQK